MQKTLTLRAFLTAKSKLIESLIVKLAIMKTTAEDSPTQRRLAQLETESQNIIDNYLKQVTVNVNSPAIKDLQNKLKTVRTEQWQLFESLQTEAPPPLQVTMAA